MTLAEILASMLCAATEVAYRRRFHVVGSYSDVRMERSRQALRWAGAIAHYYNLIPERTDDDADEE